MPQRSPEEIRSPDDRQVFSVHVGGGAEGGQVGQMSHEVFQSPVGKGGGIYLVCQSNSQPCRQQLQKINSLFVHSGGFFFFKYKCIESHCSLFLKV